MVDHTLTPLRQGGKVNSNVLLLALLTLLIIKDLSCIALASTTSEYVGCVKNTYDSLMVQSENGKVN